MDLELQAGVVKLRDVSTGDRTRVLCKRGYVLFIIEPSLQPQTRFFILQFTLNIRGS